MRSPQRVPCRSGTGDDPHRVAGNVTAIKHAGLDAYRAGHIATTGEAVALPLVELAGSWGVGDATFARAAGKLVVTAADQAPEAV